MYCFEIVNNITIVHYNEIWYYNKDISHAAVVMCQNSFVKYYLLPWFLNPVNYFVQGSHRGTAYHSPDHNK